MKDSNNISFFIRAYLMPALVVLVILFIVPFVLLPVLDRIKDQSKKLQDANTRLEFLEKKVAVLGSIDIEKETQDLFEAEVAVPSDKKLSNLVVGMRTLVSEAGASLKDMSFVNPGKVSTASAQAASEVSSTQVKIGLKGDVNSLKAFLEKVEKAKRLLLVNAVTIKYNGGDYQYDIDLIAPYKTLKNSVSKTTEPIPEIGSYQKKILNFISEKLVSFTNFMVPEVGTGNKNPF